MRKKGTSTAKQLQKRKRRPSNLFGYFLLLFHPETPAYLLCTLRHRELTKGWFSCCLILQETEHWEALTHTAISVNKVCHPCFPSSSQKRQQSAFLTTAFQILLHVSLPQNQRINIRHEALNTTPPEVMQAQAFTVPLVAAHQAHFGRKTQHLL